MGDRPSEAGKFTDYAEKTKLTPAEAGAHLATEEMPKIDEGAAQEHTEFLQFDTDRKVQEAETRISELLYKIGNLQKSQEDLRKHKEPYWHAEVLKLSEQIIPLKEQVRALQPIAWAASQLEIRNNVLAHLKDQLGQFNPLSPEFKKQADFITTLETEILADQHTLQEATFLPENLRVDTQTLFENLESAEKLLAELQAILQENPPATKAEKFTALGQIRDLEQRIPVLRGEYARRIKDQNPGRPSLRALTPLNPTPVKTVPSLQRTAPSLTIPSLLPENAPHDETAEFPLAEEVKEPQPGEELERTELKPLPLERTPNDILDTRRDIKQTLITKLQEQIDFPEPDADIAQLTAEKKQAEKELGLIKAELRRRGIKEPEFVYTPSTWAVAEKARRAESYQAGTLSDTKSVSLESLTTRSAIPAVRALAGTRHTREMAKVAGPKPKPKKATFFQKISAFFGRSRAA